MASLATLMNPKATSNGLNSFGGSTDLPLEGVFGKLITTHPCEEWIGIQYLLFVLLVLSGKVLVDFLGQLVELLVD